MDLKEPLTPFRMATVIGVTVAITITIIEYFRDGQLSLFRFIGNGLVAWLTVFLFYNGWLYLNKYIETL